MVCSATFAFWVFCFSLALPTVRLETETIFGLGRVSLVPVSFGADVPGPGPYDLSRERGKVVRDCARGTPYCSPSTLKLYGIDPFLVNAGCLSSRSLYTRPRVSAADN
ncbi:hypothetical protein SLA2020_518360 [Shorea laevis]